MAPQLIPAQKNISLNNKESSTQIAGITKSSRKSHAIPILAPGEAQPTQRQVAQNTPLAIEGTAKSPIPTSNIDPEPSLWQLYSDRLRNGQPILNTRRPSKKSDEFPTSRSSPLTSNHHKDGLPPSSSAQVKKPSPTQSEDGTIESKTAIESSLDIYANKYIPLWLRAVNKSFAVTEYSAPLQRIDYEQYISHFAGSSFLGPLPDLQLPTLKIHNISEKCLAASNYRQYWLERLQLEYASHAAQYQAYNLYRIKFEVFDLSKQLFSVKIPGIRENAPRVDLGDVLLIRPLFPVISPTIASDAQQWYLTRQGIAPGFLGVEHQGTIWSLSRKDEMVFLRIDGGFTGGLDCNIVIPVQEHKCIPTWRAVQSITMPLLNGSGSKHSWLRSILFPLETDGIMQKSLSNGVFKLDWYDKELNYEQKRAVYSATEHNYGNMPYLISGPPGTGKTKTLVETALQLLQTTHQEKVHLLICAPSDGAADTILSRLANYITPKHLFRLNNWTRSFSEVPGSVLPFCYSDNNSLFTLPDMRTLMSYAIVVTTCRDADMLVQARLTNEALSTMTSQLFELVSPNPSRGPNSSPYPNMLLHWSALLLDEAAQATEPESLIPMQVVMPSDFPGPVQPRVQVIMAGDEHQLGPRLATRLRTGHEKSLFQRLMECDVYSKHPLSRENGVPALKSSMLPILRPPFTNLIRNYRSHPAILSMPSALFYHDTLIPERLKSWKVLSSWPKWASPLRWPVLFYQNESADDVESVLEGDGTGAGSLINRGEAEIALSLVENLLQHTSTAISTGMLRQNDVLVMSPFSAQVNYLRQIFRKKGLYEVNIGPLEAFQGLESRIVLLCTTRTRIGKMPNQKPAKFVEEDMCRSLGVIGERKRFNVAITRAKEGLIVIGNASCLTCTGDECWISFLEFCQRNSLSSEPITWPDSVQQGQHHRPVIGKLEKALNYAATVKKAQESNTKSQTSRNTKLKGPKIDLDDEMWRLRELQMLEKSENIDEYHEENGDDEKNNLTNFVLSGYDRNDATLIKSHSVDVPKLSSRTKTNGKKESGLTSDEDAEHFDRDPAAELERAGCETQ